MLSTTVEAALTGGQAVARTSGVTRSMLRLARSVLRWMFWRTMTVVLHGSSFRESGSQT